MKFRRRHCLFLLLLAFFIPLNVAYLYFDYYSEIELQVRKSLSAEEEESFLVFFKKNPRIIVAPLASVQNHLLSQLENPISPFCGIILSPPNNPVLRC